MTQIFGEFIENLPKNHEFLILGFSPSSVPIRQRWRNNGLSADFIADYLTTFFPVSETEPNSHDRQAEVKSAVSYIANELLENAMKFNDEDSMYPIKFEIHLIEDTRVTVVLQVTNSVSAQSLNKFQAFIEELINSDPYDFYIQRLEDTEVSGLGLITMMNDYEAQLGWKVDTLQQEPKIFTVTTMVQLTV
ncbi:MAG: ATP-binding protein [Symploca sp. SIO1B1]|nr:ATP-binding protein [Symploca sp. SIO2D2]NER22504.1 ATP-binding protein [Symploca sp. SIO1C2]NER46133.1 ATP-binding protein [Symploca sp. SIO1A3]NER93278.1 ATP-binding protein [Symploca sp. SIO1B1]